MLDARTTHDHVKKYYGRELQGTQDLRTKACCAVDAIPPHLKPILAEIDDEIVNKFYGCGSPIPGELSGRVVLDLGCGTGRDVYLAAKLVGPRGHVIGVDMTAEQLAVASRHVDGQCSRFGYEKPNVSFHLAKIEDLKSCGIADESVDVVISNCVINLSPYKRRVFSEIFRVLKPGGELYFSDVFAGRRIPPALAADPLLHGECLGGAMYIEDFRRLLCSAGCPDYRIIHAARFELGDPQIEAKVGTIDFYTATVRAFKLDSLEDRCEDFGQIATYLGTLPEAPHAFVLDDHHTFETGRPMPVCGNTAAMLEETRFARHFKVDGDRSHHYGLFNCEMRSRSPAVGTASGNGACC